MWCSPKNSVSLPVYLFATCSLFSKISSDGPNVNLQFLDIVWEDRKDKSQKPLLEIGTCGLHVIHGSIKAWWKCQWVDYRQNFVCNVQDFWPIPITKGQLWKCHQKQCVSFKVLLSQMGWEQDCCRKSHWCLGKRGENSEVLDRSPEIKATKR